MALHINADRFKQDFDSLAQIGATGDGGVSRPALSDLHLEARRWFLAHAADAGLELPVHLEAIDFTDEEGTLVGLLGSAAIAGKLAAETLKNPRGGRDR